MPAIRLLFANHPLSVYPRFILPFAKPPSEFLHFHHRSSPFDVSSPTQGFGPLRDNTEARPLIAGFLRRLRSTLRLSNLSAASSALQLCGPYFIPQPRSGFLSRTGVSSLHTAVLPPRKALPPCRCHITHSPASRLPQVMPLDFEVFLRAEIRSSSSVISLPFGRSPLRVSAPPGSPLPPQ
jgi:hypothetical protein